MASNDIISPYKLDIFETYGTHIGLAIVILGTVFWLWQRWHGISEPQPAESTTQKSRFTSCESPDCVRCQNYHFYLSHACDNLDEFVEDFGLDGVERIANAIRDPAPVFEREDQQPNVLYILGLTAQRWWSDSKSKHLESAVQTLTDHKEEIMSEYQNIVTMDNDSSSWSTNNTPTGCWSTFYLYNQGLTYSENCELCPKTTAIIESLPGFMRSSIFGNALFSVIHPDTEITEHFGPCNVRIRCHLGLLTPPDCHLEVSDEGREWRSGQCLLFDDSFTHSAHHRGQGSRSRVILLVDLWHPEVTEKEQQALDYIFPTE